MQCDDIRELISAHLDGRLDPAGEKRLADHLAVCVSCRQDMQALQHTVQLLHELPPVALPPGLNARIRARVRQSQRSKILLFLSLPQTRVALAAGLLVILTTYGIRQMASSSRQPVAPMRQLNEPRAQIAPAQDATKKTIAPAITPAVASSMPPSAPSVSRGRIVAKPTDMVGEVALESAGAAPVLEKSAAISDGIGGGRGGMADDHTAAPASRAPRAVAATTFYAGESAKSVEGANSVFFRRSVAGDYTFRTDRLADATAIVNRYAGKTAPGGTADKRELAMARDKLAASSQPVVLEVTLAPAELPALLNELRQAGAVAVNAPGSAGQTRSADAMAAAPPPMPTGHVMMKGLAAASAAATPATAATNVHVRFVFMTK